ncbi:MAG: hypothetical protein ACP5D7_22785 [Limnospira sp.]
MTIASETKQKICDRLSAIVGELMAENPIYQEDLQAQQVVDNIFEIMVDNNLVEELERLTDEELKERCNGVMAVESWGMAFKGMSESEIEELMAAIENR